MPESPLLAVEPVQLAPPPPSSAAPKARSQVGRAVVLVLLLLGIPVLGLLLTLALIGVNIVLFRLRRVEIELIIAAVAVPVALGRAFIAMLRKPPDSPEEVEVRAADEPELHAEAARLAQQAGTRPPDRIVVVADVNAYVSEEGPLFGLLKGVRTLAVGVPLLDALTVSELRAVLGHEFGHFASGDTKMGPLAYRTQVALVEILQRLRGFSARIFVWYYRLQHRVGAGIRRGQELVADQAAVRIAGRQAAANALHKVAVASVLDEVNFTAYLAPLLQSGRRPVDLASGYRALLAQPERVSWAAEVAAAERTDPDPYASHPPTPERIRRIEALPELGPADEDDRPASSLLRDPERWARAAHERWLAVRTAGTEFEAVDWERWPEIVMQPEHQAMAADVNRVLAQEGLPSGVAGLRQAAQAGREKELSARLVASGWRAGAQGASRDFLFGALLATATTELIERGTHKWALSWRGAAEFHTVDGEDVQIHDRIAAAVGGDWSQLDELLAAEPSGRRRRSSRRRAAAEQAAAPEGAPAEGADAGAEGAAEVPAGAVPPPPSPPFELVSEETWQAELSSGLRKTTVMLGTKALQFGEEIVPFDDVVSMRQRLKDENGTVTVRLAVKTRAGEEKKLKFVGGRKNRQEVYDVYGWFFDLFMAMVAPRRNEEIAQELKAGGTVEAAGLALSAAGVVAPRRQLVPWSQVVGPVDAGPGNIGFVLADKGVPVSVDKEDAYLLPSLVPYLRALFA